jgi:hypothetical protein
MVLKRVEPLFHSQFLLARGVVYVYRIDRHHRKGEPTRVEHVLLEEPREIADALDIIANSDPNGDDDGNGFYYVMTKPPENKAIDSLLDRALGKAAQMLELPPDAEAGTVVGFVFKRNEGNTAGTPANS